MRLELFHYQLKQDNSQPFIHTTHIMK